MSRMRASCASWKKAALSIRCIKGREFRVWSPEVSSAPSKLKTHYSILLFDFESQVLNHPVRFSRSLAWSCQVTIDEDGISRIEAHGLKRAQIDLPPAADPKFLARINEAQEAKNLKAALRSQMIRPFERRSGYRMEKVDGDGIHVELSERQRHLHDIVVGLAHSDNPAAARGESGGLNILYGLHAVFVSVGRANFWIVSAARVQVVIDSLHARLFENSRLGLVHEAQRAADVDRHLAFDLAHHFSQLLEDRKSVV